MKCRRIFKPKIIHPVEKIKRNYKSNRTLLIPNGHQFLLRIQEVLFVQIVFVLINCLFSDILPFLVSRSERVNSRKCMAIKGGRLFCGSIHWTWLNIRVLVWRVCIVVLHSYHRGGMSDSRNRRVIVKYVIYQIMNVFTRNNINSMLFCTKFIFIMAVVQTNVPNSEIPV